MRAHTRACVHTHVSEDTASMFKGALLITQISIRTNSYPVIYAHHGSLFCSDHGLGLHECYNVQRSVQIARQKNIYSMVSLIKSLRLSRLKILLTVACGVAKL